MKRVTETLPILDLLRHSQECLLDVRCILGRGLQERDRELVGKFLQKSLGTDMTSRMRIYLCHTVFDHLLIGQV